MIDRDAKGPEADAWNQKAYLEIVSKNPSKLSSVPPHLLTAEICMAAVKVNGEYLMSVPDRFRTPELYRTAVGNASFALQFVPEAERTRELCELAFNGNLASIRFFPAHLMTDEMIEISLTHEGATLEHIPDERKTYLNCLTAVRQNPMAICHVPERMKTPELCRATLLGGGLRKDISLSTLFRRIPKENLSVELYELAVLRDPLVLAQIPHDLVSKDMCLNAVKKDRDMLKYVPDSLVDDEILAAYRKKEKPPSRQEIDEILEKYMYEDPDDDFPDHSEDSLSDLDEGIHRQMAEAVSHHGLLLRTVSTGYKTHEVCLAAVSQNGFALRYVPEKMIDGTIVQAALKSGGPKVLSCLPDKIFREVFKRLEDRQMDVLPYCPPGSRAFVLNLAGRCRFCEKPASPDLMDIDGFCPDCAPKAYTVWRHPNISAARQAVEHLKATEVLDLDWKIRELISWRGTVFGRKHEIEGFCDLTCGWTSWEDIRNWKK